jgi:hypothetical protein
MVVSDGKVIKTNDAGLAVRILSLRSCNVMVDIAAAMKAVSYIKDGASIRKEFLSARTPEICDNIIKELTMIMECEATTGVAVATAVAKGEEVELPDYGMSGDVKDDPGYALAP